jgi:hypothetical protein
LLQVIKGIGLLLATVVKAAIATVRQRHEEPARPPRPQPHLRQERELAPGEPDPNTPPGEPEVIRVGGDTITLPAASVAPVMLALGVALLLFGIATNIGYCVIGIILIATGLGTWTWEATHEQRHGE